jgi:hypothetical protein
MTLQASERRPDGHPDDPVAGPRPTKANRLMTSRSHSEPGLQEHPLAATSLVDDLGERRVAQRLALDT